MSKAREGYVAGEWVRLQGSYIQKEINESELHHAIISTLIEVCIDCEMDDVFLPQKLIEAVSRYHEILRVSDLRRQFRVVKDVAMKVACPMGNR